LFWSCISICKLLPSNWDTRKNLVHFNPMFVISVQLMLNSTHFVTTLVIILHVTIVANVHNCIQVHYDDPSSSNGGTRRNLVHFNPMFVIGVWLVLNSTYFFTTLVVILHVTITTNVRNDIYNYIMMNPSLGHICKYNLWLS